MTDNSVLILNEVVAQKKLEMAPEMPDADFFEIFSADQVLKDYELTLDELEYGVVDGEHDGGIDSVFAFVNGNLVLEDFDAKPYKKDVKFEIHIIQSKSKSGFSESAIDKLISSTKKLLHLGTDYAELTTLNEKLKSVFSTIRGALKSLLGKMPDIEIFFYYAAGGADSNIHPNLYKKSDELVEEACGLFPGAKVGFKFLRPQDLLALASRQKKTTYSLTAQKALRDGNGFIALIGLREYFSFLAEDGAWKAEIFEDNVRDDQGRTNVNDEILSTLIGEEEVDFWIMNNGITVLASAITYSDPTFVIENPQIVNGLQTSRQIFNFFQSANVTEESRKVMIKLVGATNEEVRDKIIKSTNSQTPVQKSSLRATDRIQRQIEVFLKSKEIFYDRRKNYYKNLGKPPSQIISIPRLSQALMSCLLNRPDDARARPSNIISKDEDYQKIFSEAYPVELYWKVAAIFKTVEIQLRSTEGLHAKDRNNIQFYVLNFVIYHGTGSTSPKAGNIAKIDLSEVTLDLVRDAIAKVRQAFLDAGGTDQVAKGSDFKDKVVELCSGSRQP